MGLRLPIQSSIDRSIPYRPFFIKSPFKEDGMVKWRLHEAGGRGTHDPGDPGPCVRPEECDEPAVEAPEAALG